MQQEQIKTLFVNILTGAVILGMLTAGYFVFVKKSVPVVGSVASVAKTAEETALIGTEIDFTVRDLGELSSAIKNSAVILDLPAFKNLQDFSVQIPSEQVGRSNPFTPASWKVEATARSGGDTNNLSASLINSTFNYVSQGDTSATAPNSIVPTATPNPTGLPTFSSPGI